MGDGAMAVIMPQVVLCPPLLASVSPKPATYCSNLTAASPAPLVPEGGFIAGQPGRARSPGCTGSQQRRCDGSG
jgi:hypothetical protein